MNTKYIPPAFPNGPGGRLAEGMSLRDYFAGQALTGLTAKGIWGAKDVTTHAYSIADAMLAERAKGE